ncbi:MAG: Gfo/Idh/MocA family oxidoreductase [Candidatus Peribacteraceae bacterium]
MSNKLRLGFVGAGFNAGFQARALRFVRGVEVAAIFAPEGAPQLAEQCRASGIGEPKVCATMKELCGAVDMVGISAPNFARLDLMREINQHGANLAGVMCEKPLARNMVEAREMVKLASPFKTAYLENQIHMPLVRNGKAQLASLEAAMGAPYIVRSAEEHGGPHSGWFWDPRQQGGGVFCDMGCHSAAVGWYLATPRGKPLNFLVPHKVQASMALAKWGRPFWKAKLLADRGVNYDEAPAEDYAVVNYTFRNPETGELVQVQATDSWCYSAPGLKLEMECMSPGFSLNINTLTSPGSLFIADYAAVAVGDMESALEKSEAGRGKLVLMENEPDTYGYVSELQDAVDAFAAGRDAMLNFGYGLDVARLVMMGYMAHEEGRTLLCDEIQDELETYVPLIQQGRGKEVLY